VTSENEMKKDAPRQSAEEVKKWLRLNLTDQVGAVTFKRLLEAFGSVDKALGATAGQLMGVEGIGAKTANQIAGSRDCVEVDKEWSLAEKLGVTIITLDSAEYPSMLKQIYDPPPVLYVKGDLQRQDQLAAAIVGSRHCSQYGREQASRFAHMLAAAGLTVVSGLARGIDTAAHRGALAAKGRTLAVQGCGLAKVFPEENLDLANEIVHSGALLSELPLEYEPLSSMFPARNRIISGLSLGTLVVEAAHRSGAMITAKFALEQNREVMALPGRVDCPTSAGPHRLLRDGATLVERVEDIMDAIGSVGQILKSHTLATEEQTESDLEPKLFAENLPGLSASEIAILDAMERETIHIEQIIEKTSLSAAQVNSSLTSLQLKGIIQQQPGGFYRRRNKT